MTIISSRIARSNCLLATLSRPTLDRILRDLQLTPLATRQSLQKRSEPVGEVIFPVTGVASMVSMGASGDSVEVATIGCEGMVGLPLFLGGDAASVDVFVQVPTASECYHLITSECERLLASRPRRRTGAK